MSDTSVREHRTLTPNVQLDTINEALSAFGGGELVVVVDNEDRENEGDLICAAETVTAQQIAFMVRHTTGIVCAPMSPSLLDQLDIPLMTSDNEDRMRTAFTVTVDATRGITTGVSAADRCHTLRTLTDPTSRPRDLARPGHILPLRAHEGGVLDRPGHTEAAIDLAHLSDRSRSGVLAELTNDDGTMMRGQQLRRFADRHSLPLISISDLIEHRRYHSH